MVSHPDLVPPAPLSVSSRTSTSHRRHHRYGRSHHGGSSYAPQNEFPFFAQTGDVEIVISAGGQEKRYLLHRLILAQCSGFFDAGTSEEWSQSQALREVQSSEPEQEKALSRINESEAGSSQAALAPPPVTAASFNNRRDQPAKRWMYELEWDDTEDGEEPMLVQKPPGSASLFGGGLAPSMPPPTPRTKPPASHSGGFFRSMANLSRPAASTTHLPQSAAGTPVNETLRDYDNLFRIFYNYPPTLNSTNIAQAYTECKALLTLADMYDALPVTGPRVDHHLLRFSSRLYKQIAKYPPSYLKLGYLARSRIIFSEALIHVVGQWPLALPHLRNSTFDVPESVIELIEDKVDEIEELKSKIEARLFRLTLTTSRGERVNPSNAYLDWLAVSLFRQWIAENTTPLPLPILKNPTGTTTMTTTNLTGTAQNIPHRGHQRPSSTRPSAAPNSYNPTRGGNTTPAPRPPPTPPTTTTTRPPPNSSYIFRLLGNPNPESYLPHSDLKRFLKIQLPSSSHTTSHHHYSDPSSSSLYTRDTLRKFERKMNEIKNVARDIVKPLMRNYLELDLRELYTSSSSSNGNGNGNGNGNSGTGGGEGMIGLNAALGYLTCVKVEDDELPWDL